MMRFPLKLGPSAAAGATAILAEVQRTDHAFPNVKGILVRMAERLVFQRGHEVHDAEGTAGDVKSPA